MRTVIQRLMAAEQEAVQLVATARAGADATLAEARRTAAELLRQSRDETGAAAEELVRVATREAERERADAVKGAGEQIAAAVLLDASRQRELVAAALQCVCGAAAVSTRPAEPKS